MSVEELLKKSVVKFDKEYLERLLNRIYSSKDLSYSNIESILSCGINPSSSIDKDATKKFLYTLIPTTIINNDIKHAMELAEITNEEEFNTKIVNESTCDVEAIKRFKNNIFNGLNGEHSVCYTGRGNLSYAILSSIELFPNNQSFRSYQPQKHQFIINAGGEKYMNISSELYKEFLDAKVPFDLVVRLPKDLPKGFSDPIRVYSNEESLLTISNIIDKVTRNHQSELYKVDDIICSSVDGLYGYTQSNFGNHRTSFSIILDTLPKIIDQWLIDYNSSQGLDYITEFNWEVRAKQLMKIKAINPDAYDNLLDEIMKYLNTLNVDLDDVFKIYDESLKMVKQQITSLDKDIEKISSLSSSLDSLMTNFNDLEEDKIEENLAISSITEENLNDNEVDAPQVVFDALEKEAPASQDEFEAMMQKEFETLAKEESNVEKSIQPQHNIDEIDNNLMDSRVSRFKASYDDEETQVLDTDSITEAVQEFDNAPVEEKAIEEESTRVVPETTEEVKEEVKSVEADETEEEINKYNTMEVELEPNNRLDETQAYTPIDQKTINDYETKKSNVPVLPDDFTEFNPVLPDDDVVSLNTGSYQTIPVEVTGFNDDEVKSIVNTPQNTLDVDLGEYSDVITSAEAVTPIINTYGESSTILEDFKQEGVINKVPVNAQITLNDGSVINGKDFIRNFVIPIVKQNTREQVYPIDSIINNYSTSIVIPKEKKKGFFSSLFHKHR